MLEALRMSNLILTERLISLVIQTLVIDFVVMEQL